MNVGKIVALSAVVLAMAVPSFAQQQQGRGGRGGRGNLLAIPEVQTELKLDAAQKDLVQQLNMEMQQKRQALFQNGGQGGDRQAAFAKMQELQAEQDKKVTEILNKDQVVRYKQLQLQQQGIRALDRKEVADQLKLSGDQKNQIATAITGEREAMRAAFQNAQGGDRQAAFAKMQELRQQTDTKLNGILTEPQKAQFEKLKGAPFTFPQRQRGNGGNANRRQRNGNAA